MKVQVMLNVFIMGYTIGAWSAPGMQDTRDMYAGYA